MTKILLLLISFLLLGRIGFSELDAQQELLWKTFEQSNQFFLNLNDYTCTVEHTVLKDGKDYSFPPIALIYAQRNNYAITFKDNDNFLQEFLFIDGITHRQFVYPKNYKISSDGSFLYNDVVISIPENSLSFFYDEVIPLCEVHKKELNWKFLGKKRVEEFETISFEVTFDKPVLLDKTQVKSLLLVFSKSNALPVSITIKDITGEAVEHISFNDLDVNIGLSDNFFATKLIEKTQQKGIVIQKTPITEDTLLHDPAELQQFVVTISKLSLEKFTAIEDYTGTFIRQERMGKRLNPTETIFFKFRKPFDLYLKFINGPSKGYELLYARGKYNNQMLVHVSGFANIFLPTIELDPAGGIAMMHNRHSILEFGLGYVIESYYRDLKTSIQYNELRLKYHGTANVDNRPCWVIEAWLPHTRDIYYCSRSIMYFDQEYMLPTKMIFYDWNPRKKKEELIEQYTYSDLSFNNGLTDYDFDRQNKEYKF